jgi:hypothetical protein
VASGSLYNKISGNQDSLWKDLDSIFGDKKSTNTDKWESLRYCQTVLTICKTSEEKTAGYKLGYTELFPRDAQQEQQQDVKEAIETLSK